MTELSLSEKQHPMDALVKKIYFLHIPKCAGMSIRHEMVKAYNPWLTLEVNTTNTPEEMYPDEYDQAAAFYGHAFWDTIEEAFKFTFLRHPQRRLLSLYNYVVGLEGEGRSHYRGLGVTKDMTPDEFVDGAPFANIDNGIVRQLAGIPFLYETEYEPVNMYHLRIAMETLGRLDFVGFVETFQADFDRLAPRIGLKAGASIETTNRSRQFVLLTPELGQVFMERNEYDIRLYEYAIREFGK